MRIGWVIFMVALLGAGCTETAPVVPADSIDFHDGATVQLTKNWALHDLFASEEDSSERTVTIDVGHAGESAKISWSHAVRRETEASKAARSTAQQAPIGENITVPDAVYENVVTTGTVATDALGNAERIMLPSYWMEGDMNVSDEGNSVLWLSRAQYDELVATTSSHIALGLFDSTLQNFLDVGDKVRNSLATLQGNIATDTPQSNYDVTLLTADDDWGDYVLNLNGTRSTVAVITAKSAFARYVILANPANPLVLKVSMQPLSLGLGMLSALRTINSFAGYHVTAITY